MEDGKLFGSCPNDIAQDPDIPLLREILKREENVHTKICIQIPTVVLYVPATLNPHSDVSN